jgi:hypothetical protein
MDRDRPGQRKFLLLSLKIEETNLDSDISDNEFSIVKWSRMFWKKKAVGLGGDTVSDDRSDEGSTGDVSHGTEGADYWGGC